MEIKEGRKFKSKHGHTKVEVLFVNGVGVIYKDFEEYSIIRVVSTDEFRKIFKPITTHEVFRVWKFLECDTLTSKQKATSILQRWPQESDGKTLEELYNVLSNDWFVEEEIRKIKRRDKMNDIDIESRWDYLVDTGIATEKELQLITNINGYNMESLNDVIYVKTGYRTAEQLQEEETEENWKT